MSDPGGRMVIASGMARMNIERADTDQKDTVPATPFREMADRINHNSATGFGGAVVIVPPDGDPVQFLVLDPKQDPAMFWANVKTKAEIALAEMDEKQRQANMAFGGRR